MRILVISSKMPYPPRDGGAIATLNLALGLARAGHDTSLFVLNTRKHYFPPEQVPDRITREITLHSTSIDTRIHPAELLRNLFFSRTPYIATRFYDPNVEEELRRLLKKETYDVIQLEGPYLASYIPAIRSESRARIALRAHNVEHEIWQRKARGERRPFHKLYLQNLTSRVKQFEKQCLDSVNMVIPISDRDNQSLRSLGCRRPMMTIPAGLDISSYTPQVPTLKGSLFFIGSLDWLPNQEGLEWFMNRILPLVCETHPKVQLHVAGRNAPDSLLQTLSHPNVVFHGEVDSARTFMQHYDIMIAPLLTGSGIRIKILEGMALGKPIVTTSIGAEGIPAEKSTHLMMANESRAFAEKITQLLASPELRQSLSEQAQQLIRENFDTFVLSKRLADFYTQHI